MGNTNGTILYLSYDGLLEPLGQSQILQYLESLCENYKIVLVTFEKKSDWSNVECRRAIQRRLDDAGIQWVPRKYHKSPAGLATAFDVVRGIFLGFYLVLRHKIQIVHARSYVPAIIALCIKRLRGTGFVFDMRGFWPDERVNAGQWSEESKLYKLVKWFEKRFLLEADIVISLTEAAVEDLKKLPYLNGREPDFRIIPTCVNMSIFKPATPKSHGRKGAADEEELVLGCVGSVDGWFRFDAVLSLFNHVLEQFPHARLLILNRGQHEFIRELIARTGISPDHVEIKSSDYTDVAQEMAKMDVGVFFYQPSYSELARSPTKLGEFLSCGIPCITNRGIGDSEKIIADYSVGIVLDVINEDRLTWASRQIVELIQQPNIQADCIRTAEKYFSLADGVKSYSDCYAAILSGGGRRS